MTLKTARFFTVFCFSDAGTEVALLITVTEHRSAEAPCPLLSGCISQKEEDIL